MNKFLKYYIVISLTILGCKKSIVELSEKALIDNTEAVAKLSKKSGRNIVLNSERNYSRNAINKAFNLKKAEMHSEALQRGQKENLKSALFTDSYTGKRLLGGSSYEFDHVRSAEYLYNKYKSILTDDEIAQVVNCNENIVATSTKINRSKGKRSLEALLNNPEKIKELEINSSLARKTIKNADEGIKRKISELISNR